MPPFARSRGAAACRSAARILAALLFASTLMGAEPATAFATDGDHRPTTSAKPSKPEAQKPDARKLDRDEEIIKRLDLIEHLELLQNLELFDSEPKRK